MLETTAGVRMELLAWGHTAMEPHLFCIKPNGGSGESYAHEGEEFLHVLQGEFEIWLGDKGALQTENRGQFVFRQFDATPVEKSREDGDATAVGEYAADVLGLRSLDF